MNYYSKLPNEIKEYIQNIIKKDTIDKLKVFRLKNREEKKMLIYKLIWDLRVRNNCWRFENPIIDSDGINTPFIQNGQYNIISINDPYTERILSIIDDLIKGNEFFGDEPLLSITLWNRFLWALSMGIWEDSDNSKIFTYTENLYYSLRTKTARGALMNNGISLFNLAPPLIEKIPLSELE